MKIKANTNTTIRAGTTLVLTSFLLAGNAMAQNKEVVANMDRPADSAASCEAMTFNQEFVTSYPWAAEACHTVVVVNGENWARFEGKFQGTNDDGSFDTEFVNRSNRNLGRVTLLPEAGQTARIDKKEVRFSDLKRGQVLSFYVPEHAVGFAIEPQAKLVKIVSTKETNTYANNTPEPKEEPVLLAQADTRTNERNQRASELPRTAGPLPMFALGGLITMLGGLGMTIRRRMPKHNS